MGGVVSTGHDNDDLVDNLKEAKYIKTEIVEQVFRIVDRSHYYLPECRESAYKDLAWKSGTLHLSAPCIYSEVMEALELRKGLSFLNLGSGTGYLNTMVGFMIGPYGINHGIELHATNVSYAEERLKELKETCPKFDDLELCEPNFVEGNCLNLAPDNRRYDRVYCGAACATELLSTMQNMIKMQGILVVPVGDQLLKITRVGETDFVSENVLAVSFAALVQPSEPKEVQDLIMMSEINPMSLQDICRMTVRDAIRSTFTFEKPPPKSPKESSKQRKTLQATRFFRSERGRYPLNILPTTQGLMIMGAFSDDSEASDGSEQIDAGFLDEQLQRHALGRMQNVDTTEVDSTLSDNDEPNSKTENDEEDEERDEYRRSARMKLETMESEDGIVADDEEDDDEMELKELAAAVTESHQDGDMREEIVGACSLKKNNSSKMSKPGSNSKGNSRKVRIISRKTWVETRELPKPIDNRTSISSDDDIIVPESNVNSSPAIEMNVIDANANARSVKTSYSTSADTSETSGFGSLGDDHIGPEHSGIGHVGFKHSRIGQTGPEHSGIGLLDEDMDMNEEKSDRSVNKSCMLSDHAMGKSNIKKPVWLERSHQSNSSEDAGTVNNEDEGNGDDDDDSDDSMEETFMDLDDYYDYDPYGNRNRKTASQNSRGNVGKNISESTTSDDADKDDAESCEEVKPPSLPPSGFTVFLKKQVDTLPIPNTMKSYICHFR